MMTTTVTTGEGTWMNIRSSFNFFTSDIGKLASVNTEDCDIFSWDLLLYVYEPNKW